MDATIKQKLIDYLFTYATDNKQEKMHEVLELRTRHVTVAIEDIFQGHNANAVVRSAECFGLQDIHVIEDRYKFAVSSGVAMGSTKWMDIHRYGSTPDCFETLRKQGYKIIATTPHATAHTLYELPLQEKLALVFGTENVGLSSYALEHADGFVTIPMYGFTQSFNISVSVALCLQHIITALHGSDISWRLSPDEKRDILLVWLRKTVRAADKLEAHFLQNLV